MRRKVILCFAFALMFLSVTLFGGDKAGQDGPAVPQGEVTREFLSRIRVGKEGNFQYWNQDSPALKEFKDFIARVTDTLTSHSVCFVTIWSGSSAIRKRPPNARRPAWRTDGSRFRCGTSGGRSTGRRSSGSDAERLPDVIHGIKPLPSEELYPVLDIGGASHMPVGCGRLVDGILQAETPDYGSRAQVEDFPDLPCDESIRGFVRTL